MGEFDVVEGGLTVHDLVAEVTPRGKVRFSFSKYFRSGTKAASREYTFDEIAKADLSLKNSVTGVRTAVKGLKTEFSIHFYDKDEVEDGYQTSSLSCD